MKNTWKGIANTRRIRHRAPDKRGGTDGSGDGLSRNNPLRLASLNDSYLESLAVHNYSKHTIQGHRKRLRAFLHWCEQRELLNPEQIIKPILESYQRHLYRHRKQNGNPLSVRTQRQHLGSIQGYFKWLCRQNYLLSNPASELELPRAEQRLPVLPLSQNEVETILSQPDLNDPLGIRDRAILELLYSTGMRRSEVTNLTRSQIDFERQILVVRQGKGKKDRVLPIGHRALKWLKKYLDQVRPELLMSTAEDTFFLSSYGEMLNADVLSRTVRNYIQQADIGRSGSCHLFRHTCAGHMLENGADIRYIQQLLGHSDLKTTEVYTELSIHQLQKVHSLTHPGSQKTESKP